MKNRYEGKYQVLKWKPNQGKTAFEFCWHDRKLELQTEDGRVIATHHHGQLRPCNAEVWATYFDPPVVIREKR